jgi:hypothetical protein
MPYSQVLRDWADRSELLRTCRCSCATTVTGNAAAAGAAAAAAAAGSQPLDARGQFGAFLVKDIERRQVDVGNFFLTEEDFITL